jgi:hypothetical protein
LNYQSIKNVGDGFRTFPLSLKRKIRMSGRFLKLNLLLLFLLIPVLAACSSTSVNAVLQSMPDYVHSAPHRVQEAYLYAHDHSEMLEYQPCYCGCGAMGHLNNLDCFIQEIDEVGNVTYDSHASGCGICVDIALDVKRMAAEGWSQLQIRLYIDATYSQFGPSTDTPMPEA